MGVEALGFKSGWICKTSRAHFIDEYKAQRRDSSFISQGYAMVYLPIVCDNHYSFCYVKAGRGTLKGGFQVVFNRARDCHFTYNCEEQGLQNNSSRQIMKRFHFLSFHTFCTCVMDCAMDPQAIFPF